MVHYLNFDYTSLYFWYKFRQYTIKEFKNNLDFFKIENVLLDWLQVLVLTLKKIYSSEL